MGKTETASSLVFEKINEAIMDGTWKPGEKIPSENKLAAQYEVSRVTIRAAIQRLSSLGLLESRQGGGTYVLTPGVERRLDPMIPYFALTSNDRVNVAEFRHTLEAEAAALAAQRANGEIIERMREACRQMEEAESQEDIAKYDLEFHRLISEATGNPIFLKVFHVLQSTYHSLLQSNVNAIGAAGVKYHYMLTYAIEARDPDIARSVMIRHLEEAMYQVEVVETPEE